MHGAIDGLPLDQTHALWLVDVRGLTYAGAATEIGITHTQLAGRLHRARTTIRKTIRGRPRAARRRGYGEHEMS